VHDARYARSVVAALNETRENQHLHTALASLYAMKPIEVPNLHEEPCRQSKYRVQPDSP